MLEEFLQACLSSLKDSLVTQYKNSQGDDISDITRGRIIALQEILTLDKAIEGYKNMTKQATQFAEQPKKEGPAL